MGYPLSCIGFSDGGKLKIALSLIWGRFLDHVNGHTNSLQLTGIANKLVVAVALQDVPVRGLANCESYARRSLLPLVDPRGACIVCMV